MRKAGKQTEPVPIKRIPVSEFSAADPDYLRDLVFRALSSLTAEQRPTACGELLVDLERAGLNIRQAVLMLGLSARRAEDSTPAEIATLIRYVRLTEPKIMKAMAPALAELVAATPAPKAHLSAQLGRIAGSRLSL